MAINKVVYDGDTLVDLTSDTVTPETLAKGYTAHGADGEAIVGTMEAGGGGAAVTAPMKDVNFYDYDGTRLYSYTVTEAQALTELPALPTQPGLACQGWNWTLEDIKAMNRAVDVGAIYITDDGKTRLYITISAEGRMDVPLYFSQTIANGATIDWGDGSATQSLTGTGTVNTTHTYANVGDYVITLTATEGCTLGLGGNASGYCVMGSTGNNSLAYCNMLQKVELGKGAISIGAYAFHNCRSLANVVIPGIVTSIGGNAFYNCSSLANVVIPGSATSIGSNAFSDCYSLASVVIPGRVTSIGVSAFYKCWSLASIVIPDSVTLINNWLRECHSLASVVIPGGVTSLGANSFNNCYGIAFYDFTLLKKVPTLASNGTFNNISPDCQIRVPAALYDEWISAANWSARASQIVAV
jgi:hypothetical protein